MKRILITIAILAFAGVAVSAYALWQHYAPLGAAFCNLGETFSCDLVNKSAFSEVFGIPVAGIGIAGYLALFALTLGAIQFSPPHDGRGSKRGWGTQHSILGVLFTASLIGFAFSAYLTYIELFVIGAVCVLCVASQAIILAITALTGMAWKRIPFPSTLTCPHCGATQQAEIPTGKCVPFYRCDACGKIVQAKTSCCVFCDYGDRKCPVGH